MVIGFLFRSPFSGWPRPLSQLNHSGLVLEIPQGRPPRRSMVRCQDSQGSDSTLFRTLSHSSRLLHGVLGPRCCTKPRLSNARRELRLLSNFHFSEMPPPWARIVPLRRGVGRGGFPTFSLLLRCPRPPVHWPGRGNELFHVKSEAEPRKMGWQTGV